MKRDRFGASAERSKLLNQLEMELEELETSAAEDEASATQAITGTINGSVANFIGVRVQPSLWDVLPRQRIELLRRTQFVCRLQLTLADHVHEFDTGEGRRS
jgi:hypothetical protein